MERNLGKFELLSAKTLYFYILIEFEKVVEDIIPQIYDTDELTFYDLYSLFGKFKFFKNFCEYFWYNQFIYYHNFINNCYDTNDNEIKYLFNLKKDLFKYSNILNNYYEKCAIKDLNNEFEKLIKSKNKITLNMGVLNKIKNDELNGFKLIEIQNFKTKNFYTLNDNLGFNDIIMNIFNSNPIEKSEIILLKNQVKYLKNSLKLIVNGPLLFIYLNQMNILKYSKNKNFMTNFINLFEINNSLKANIFKKINILINERDMQINFNIKIHKKLMRSYINSNKSNINIIIPKLIKDTKIDKNIWINWWRYQYQISEIKEKNIEFKYELEKEEYLKFNNLYWKESEILYNQE